ncbi:GTP pyrophosphokinase [Novimethylophilus kurashikiensis]|uniref:GTP pyrophosphokinase n=1 Tax=Novimethylophilus kurashikiensis TaxID=1825523 RepID=A0A2R5FD39_9PROT|nr:hypothetical protein [Novimethylophilus kurashikiensis]GBG14601.1 GTP pyrophosphokinase [Novimethylophilus kurashikiensis]
MSTKTENAATSETLAAIATALEQFSESELGEQTLGEIASSVHSELEAGGNLLNLPPLKVAVLAYAISSFADDASLSVPNELNQFQQAALEVYDEGFNAISKASDIPKSGDLFLRFLMAELSEDCDDLGTAIRRLESAKSFIELNLDRVLLKLRTQDMIP